MRFKFLLNMLRFATYQLESTPRSALMRRIVCVATRTIQGIGALVPKRVTKLYVTGVNYPSYCYGASSSHNVHDAIDSKGSCVMQNLSSARCRWHKLSGDFVIVLMSAISSMHMSGPYFCLRAFSAPIVEIAVMVFISTNIMIRSLSSSAAATTASGLSATSTVLLLSSNPTHPTCLTSQRLVLP